MAQIEKTAGQDGASIKPSTPKSRKVTREDETTGETVEGVKVLPREDTAVYATKGSKHLGKHGTKHIVHRVLADKLVDNGEATLEEPKNVAVTLTAAELKALTEELGKKPTKSQIEAAIKTKALAAADNDEQEDEL